MRRFIAAAVLTPLVVLTGAGAAAAAPDKGRSGPTGLDLTDVPNGDDYYLVSRSNFAGVFTESNPGNNTAWVRFRLYSDSNGNRKVEVTGNSPCVMGSGMCGENATNR
jgi:hypothetical protein